MNTKLIAAALLAATAATPAFAQDAADASGFRVAGLVGVDHVVVDDGTDSGSETGVAFGLSLGYDFDLGGAVLGLEGEVADSSVDTSDTDLFVTGDSAKLSAGRDLYIGARVGGKVGTGLLYVKGGYTNTRLTLDYTGTTAGSSFSASDNIDGFRLGAGGEFPVSANLGIRIEYRYSNYGEYSYNGVGTGLDVERHQGMIGLVGRF